MTNTLPIESLCQDCLRPQPAHPDNEGKCVCGGQTCSCPTCQSVLRLLRASDPTVTGYLMNLPAAWIWTEENGLERV